MQTTLPGCLERLREHGRPINLDACGSTSSCSGRYFGLPQGLSGPSGSLSIIGYLFPDSVRNSSLTRSFHSCFLIFSCCFRFQIPFPIPIPFPVLNFLFVFPPSLLSSILVVFLFDLAFLIRFPMFSHWGQDLMSRPGTLQIHCKEMDKEPAIYPPGTLQVHSEFSQPVFLQFPWHRK